MPTERIIGIDFGTSTSVVKVKTYRDGKPLDAPELADYVRFDGKSAVPTLVYRFDGGETLAGYEAENASLGGGGELFYNFKLDLISEDRETKSRAVRLTEDFFKYLYEMYDDQRDNFTPVCDTETTYVSFPAKWPREAQKAMADIAAEVGFKNVKGIDEPTAALYAVLIQKGDELRAQGLITQGKGVNLLMIDMGAGTTDLALCRYTPGSKMEMEILNTWPKAGSEILFGGREIDRALCGYVTDYLVSCGLAASEELTLRCLPDSKRWKEANVSGSLKNTDGVVAYCGFTGSFLMWPGIERKQFPPLDRRGFEGLLGGYIRQYPKLVRECVENTEGISPQDIDLVILTGGHSQWYFASEILDGSIGAHGSVDLPKVKAEPGRIVSLKLPQETVALGMVYQRLSVRVEAAKPKGEVDPTVGIATFDVVLTRVGVQGAIPVIKALRELTGWSLREAKAFVDSAPRMIKERIPKDEAQAIRDRFMESGAIVTIRENIITTQSMETSTFDVELTSAGEKGIIFVIKAVREVTGWGLLEAKTFVESAPRTIKAEVSKSEAQSINEGFSQSGAVITIRKNAKVTKLEASAKPASADGEEWEIEALVTITENQGALNRFMFGSSTMRMHINRRHVNGGKWEPYVSLKADSKAVFPLGVSFRGWLIFNTLEYSPITFRTRIDLSSAARERLSLNIKSYKIVDGRMFVIAGPIARNATKIYEYDPEANLFLPALHLSINDFPDLEREHK